MLNNHLTSNHLLRSVSARCWLAVACALSCPAITTASAATLQTGTIVLESGGSTIDGNTNLVVLTKVVITQGGYTVSADEARVTGLNFDNSRWNFSGHVQVTTPDGRCNAEQAIVVFKDNQINNVQISGKPATLEQRSASDQLLAEGRAEQIDYDFTDNTVRMKGQAWLRYDQKEFSGYSVTYDMLGRRIMAPEQDQNGKRIRITIQPGSGSTSVGSGTSSTDKSHTP